MNNTKEVEDEVSLFGIAKVIVKRRVLIVGGTLFFLVLALITSFLLPQIYRVSFVVDIGMMQWGNERLLIESQESVKSKVSMSYGYSVMKEMSIAEQEFPILKIKTPKDTGLIEVWVEMSDREKGISILQKVMDNLKKDHDRILNPIKVRLQNDAKRMKTAISMLDDENENNKNNIKGIQQSLNNPQRISATSQLLTLQTNISENNIEKMRLEEKLILTQSDLDAIKETRIVKSATASERPVSPNKRLIVVTGVMLGLMISVFFAFFMEFVEMYRQEMDEG